MRLKSFNPLNAFSTPTAQLVETFVEAELLFSVIAIGNDRLGAALHLNRDQAPFSICECMNLRVLRPPRERPTADPLPKTHQHRIVRVSGNPNK
jgi:hypothetical protein